MNQRKGFLTFAVIILPFVMLAAIPGTAATNFSVIPNQLTFLFQTGVPSSNTANLTPASNGSPVTYSVTTSAGTPWLLVSATSVTTPNGIVVTIDTTSLPMGTFKGSVTFTDVSGGGSAQVPVTVFMQGPPPPPPPQPTISSFIATPATISSGQTTTLSWSVANAPNVSLDQGNGAAPVTGNSLVVKPTATTLYTLFAGNPGIVTSAQVIVGVNGPAVMPFLTVDKPNVAFNFQIGGVNPSAQIVNVGSTGGLIAYSTFAGVFQGTTNWVSVTPATGGNAPDPITISVNPAGLTPGTYTGVVSMTELNLGNQCSIDLTAIPCGISVNVTLTVTDPSAPSPSITSFSASPSTVLFGQASTLSWVVANAASVSIDQFVGTVTGSSVTVVPNGTVTYTLTATGGNGATVSKQVTVTLAQSPIFVSNPAAISFNYVIGGPAPAAQTINVTNAINVHSSFDASPGILGGGNWLNVTPSGGTTPTTLNVSVNITGFNFPGNVTGAVNISDVSGANNCFDNGTPTPCFTTVPVSLTITTQTATSGNITLTVAEIGTGTGTITSNIGGINCGSTCSASFSSATIVTLTATAAPGSIFAGWSGGGCAGGGTCGISLNSNLTVTASFLNVTPPPPPPPPPGNIILTVADAGTGSGTITSDIGGINCGSSCSASFSSTTTVTLTATAASGSSFAGWSGGSCSVFGVCTVFLTSSQTVMATFNSVTPPPPPPAAPVITSTLSVTAIAGQPFSFQIMATNGPNIFTLVGLPSGLSVDQNTGLISGTPTIASVYQVSLNVGNSSGNALAILTLTINPAPGTPVITTQPTTQTVLVGQPATFTVIATGNAPLSYQWQLCTLIPTGCSNIAGATASSYTTPPPTQPSSGILNSYFQVIVTNSFGSILSNAVYLIATPVGGVVITQQPVDQTVAVGQTATFSVVATSTSPLSYQWGTSQCSGGGCDFLAILGATGSSYTTPPTVSTDTGKFYVARVMNSVNTVTSAYALLTVTNTPTAPNITSPLAASGVVGTAFSYTITADHTISSYTVTGLPASLSVNVNSGAISGTPVAADLGPHNIGLRATNSNGTGPAATLVLTISSTTTPPPPPVISSFTATPASITSGQSSTLSWLISNASTLAIDQGVGSVTGLTSVSVSPTVTTTYTLTATNSAGISVTKTVTVTVTTTTPPPVISSFIATPASITSGGSSTLSWVTANATTLSIDQGVGSVTGMTSVSVSPSTTTTYTLTATNSAGVSVTKTVMVTVTNTPPPPVINSFTATPASITSGGSSTLSWSANNATALSIDQGVGSVTGLTSVIVIPSTTTTYTLTATNSAGVSVTRTVTVTVTVTTPPPPPPPPPVPSTPTLSLPAILPINATITAGYTGTDPASFFQWTFTPVTQIPAGSLSASMAISAGAPSASFTTSSPRANLSNVTLGLGPYLITVKVIDNNGVGSATAQAAVTMIAADLSAVREYPNPWRSDKHTGHPITFDQLSGNTTIKIFTMSAHLVKTLSSNTGSVTWDLTNDSGERVASGIYHYLIKNDQGQKTTGQLAIIK